MSKNQINNNNNLFCSHLKTINEIILGNITYAYCEECGSISIKHNNTFYYTIKSTKKQKPTEIDPILITNNMKKIQDLSYPDLNNIYNLNIKDNTTIIKQRIALYIIKRNLILLYLQNITRQLNYSDLSFYHCLLLVDLYLSHNITDEMDEEELLYILIGFFLISSKFKETDIFEPDLLNFNNIDSNIIVSFEQILLYETKCLKIMKYNFFIYSTYDWINIFMSNGFVFEVEIDIKENINEIYTYTYKLLITLTPKNIFIKYSPLYLAISIIQIVREDKIEENKINNELFKKLLNLYNITFEDYENCYRDIKLILYKEKDTKEIKSQNVKLNTSPNQTPIFKNKENKSFEKQNNNINNTAKIIDLNQQSRLNLKNTIKDIKINRQFINLTSSGKVKKNFHSIIVNNIKTNKNRNFNKIKKNLEILEYINSNLPSIYNNGTEQNKILKTEGETISGMKYKIGIFKHDALNNFQINNKIKRNKIGSIDNYNIKRNEININKGKRNISPLKFTNIIRNGTYDTLGENEKKISKYIYKNNTNIFHTDNNSTILNKSSHNNTNINNNDDKEANLIIKNYIGNSKNKINNNNINNNIFKNYSNIYKNNLKPLFRQSTSDYPGANDLKVDLPLFLNNNAKDVGSSNKKKIDNIKKKDFFEKVSSSIEKQKENELNIFNNSNNNINNNNNNSLNSYFLMNLKNAKNILNTGNDLLSLKKSVYNTKLPKLKLKIDKNN